MQRSGGPLIGLVNGRTTCAWHCFLYCLRIFIIGVLHATVAFMEGIPF